MTKSNYIYEPALHKCRSVDSSSIGVQSVLVKDT